MGKIKIEKKDIWIDMTPMSDVMTLLLCFFMLTSTFLTPEPVKVNTPGSVSEVKVPENDVLNILVSPEGNIYVGSENKNTMLDMMQTVTGKFGISLTGEKLKHFREDAMIGAPISVFEQYYALDTEKMGEEKEKCIVVEDSYNGTLAGKRADMLVIGIRNEGSGHQDLSNADIIIDQFSELEGILL